MTLGSEVSGVWPTAAWLLATALVACGEPISPSASQTGSGGDHATAGGSAGSGGPGMGASGTAGGVGPNTMGIAGESAGVGGDSAGVGGDSAGVGGDSAGVGGDGAGVGGDGAGVGGDGGAGGNVGGGVAGSAGAGTAEDWIAIVRSDDACPEGGEKLGTCCAGATMCSVPGYRQFALFDPADACPANWVDLGPNFMWRTCGATGARSAVVLDRSAAGAESNPSQRGSLCPAGTTFIGMGSFSNLGGGEVCEYATEHTVAQITSADTCPSGWTFVGKQFGESMCVKEGPGTVLWLTGSCPTDFTSLGQMRGAETCYSPTPHAVTGLSQDCPPDWRRLGTVGSLNVCVR